MRTILIDSLGRIGSIIIDIYKKAAALGINDSVVSIKESLNSDVWLLTFKKSDQDKKHPPCVGSAKSAF